MSNILYNSSSFSLYLDANVYIKFRDVHVV
jgi:hypothetical protein